MVRSLKKSDGSYRHGNLRRAILDASLQTIEKNGIAALSIREVAKRVGVTHQAPYRHFKDRDALLAALAQEGLEKLKANIAERVSRAKTPFDKIKALSRGYLSWAIEHRVHFRMIFSQDIPDFESFTELQATIKDILELILHVTTLAQEAKLIREGETRSFARQIWAAIHGVALLFIDGQFKPLKNKPKAGQAFAEELITNLVRGFGRFTNDTKI